MRSSEIIQEWKVLPQSGDEAELIFMDAGWDKVGHGFYADVYSKPGIDYVVKVFERDSAYLAYLNLIKHHPNPHFPRIKGRLHISPTLNGVRLEKLEKVYQVQVGSLTVGITGMLNAYLISKDYNLSEYQQRNLELANIYLADHPQLVEALDLIYINLLSRSSRLSGYSLDLNTNNVMQRSDGTIVIIDPVAS